MAKTSNINIVSFIIRFVQEQTEDDGELYSSRGVIRNIQTDKEVQFAHWEEAVEFIRQFVSIDQIPEDIGTKRQSQS
jgi:hypothetical protein